jgi:hypothetical protein
VAWLQYATSANARNAQEVLKTRDVILGRKIECSIQYPPLHARNPIWSIQVGNLDALTQTSHFYRILFGTLKPTKVVLGQPSHSFSETEASRIVESILKKHGDLESFQFHAIPGSVKLKATATFTNRDQAVEAVKSLHNTKISRLGNSKIFLSHLISVKYNVLTIIHNALDVELSKLRQDIWQSGHVHLKSYSSNDSLKPITTVRIFGEDSKRISEAKVALEKILAGSVVTKEESTL